MNACLIGTLVWVQAGARLSVEREEEGTIGTRNGTETFQGGKATRNKRCAFFEPKYNNYERAISSPLPSVAERVQKLFLGWCVRVQTPGAINFFYSYFLKKAILKNHGKRGVSALLEPSSRALVFRSQEIIFNKDFREEKNAFGRSFFSMGTSRSHNEV